MSIRIEKSLCTGCGKCQRVCPGSLIKADEMKKAYIKYPKNCWGCAACLKECEHEAIHYYLGAELGGRGAFMQYKKEGDFTHWIITGTDGLKEEIVIDRRESSHY